MRCAPRAPRRAAPRPPPPPPEGGLDGLLPMEVRSIRAELERIKRNQARANAEYELIKAAQNCLQAVRNLHRGEATRAHQSVANAKKSLAKARLP